MRGYNHCHFLRLDQVFNIVPNVFSCLRIKSQRGLVEEKNARIVQETTSQLKSSTHPTRIFLDHIVLSIAKINKIQHVVDSFLTLLLRDAEHKRVKIEIFATSKDVVAARILEYDSNRLSDLSRLCDNVVATYLSGSR